MSRDSVEEFTHRGLNVRIEYDTDPTSPREWDNLGTMVCWHRRYTLGDKHDFSDPDDFKRMLSHEDTLVLLDDESDDYKQRLYEEAEKSNVILPLYLYDHSGITMNTSGFHCPWDSGQVGYIYMSHDKVQKEYGAVNDETLAKARECLKGEVKDYDDYLTGQVYGFIVEDTEGEHLDSCWGFYGLDYCIEQAKEAAEAEADHIAAQVEGESIDHD